MNKFKLGIDIGSTTVKIAVLDDNNNILFSDYERHFANIQETLQSLLEKAVAELGEFEVYPVILSKYGALPTKSQLEVIKNRIVEDNVKYIVYEPNMTEDMIQLFDELQEELGLTRVELSNLSSLTEDEKNSGKDYISIMYENLQVLELMVENRE